MAPETWGGALNKLEHGVLLFAHRGNQPSAPDPAQCLTIERLLISGVFRIHTPTGMQMGTYYLAVAALRGAEDFVMPLEMMLEAKIEDCRSKANEMAERGDEFAPAHLLAEADIYERILRHLEWERVNDDTHPAQ